MASRLPAGSTMTLPNGITVPHPAAAATEPGQGDVRAVGTTAVDETQAGVQQPFPKPNVLTGAQTTAIAVADAAANIQHS